MGSGGRIATRARGGARKRTFFSQHLGVFFVLSVFAVYAICSLDTEPPQDIAHRTCTCSFVETQQGVAAGFWRPAPTRRFELVGGFLTGQKKDKPEKAQHELEAKKHACEDYRLVHPRVSVPCVPSKIQAGPLVGTLVR